ncbi:Uncharacterized protein dnm_087590 [Desulfonema magnum]|uniref:Uncharacterized protein n=1 Tax=Desulfonema magnum TaxID=45655 RepID=A0A975BVT2_9BACT|nr:Uncharacterized protein dnm_087570 [Desulfonema magnum]QTA92671.1 Uncharacterized protein dnm_087580 [Desulfonema magnum]QTA92672.1 Uncharacterized protein dnm_087590 [Desulfonema magnum]
MLFSHILILKKGGGLSLFLMNPVSKGRTVLRVKLKLSADQKNFGRNGKEKISDFLRCFSAIFSS